MLLINLISMFKDISFLLKTKYNDFQTDRGGGLF